MVIDSHDWDDFQTVISIIEPGAVTGVGIITEKNHNNGDAW